MRYKGTFNWQGEVHTLYTQAKDKNDAYRKFTYRLAPRLGRVYSSVRLYFNGSKDNYTIEEVQNERATKETDGHAKRNE